MKDLTQRLNERAHELNSAAVHLSRETMRDPRLMLAAPYEIFRLRHALENGLRERDALLGVLENITSCVDSISGIVA